MRKIIRRIGVPFIAGTALLGGLAFGAFTPIGVIFGDGHTATAQNLTTVAAQADSDLWPGECTSVTFTLHNPNPRAIEITSAEQHGETGGGINAVEAIRNVVHSNIGSDALVGERIAAGDSRTFTIPNAVCLTSNATDAAQSSAFTVVELFRTKVVAGSNPAAQF